MAATDSAATATISHSACASDSSELGFLESAKLLLSELQGIAHDRLLLATLEIKKAGLSLVAMVIYGIFAAVLLAASWMALVSAGLLWAISRGVPWPAGLLAAAVLNVCVAIGFILAIRSRSNDLLFPATLRRLPAADHDPTAD